MKKVIVLKEPRIIDGVLREAGEVVIVGEDIPDAKVLVDEKTFELREKQEKEKVKRLMDLKEVKHKEDASTKQDRHTDNTKEGNRGKYKRKHNKSPRRRR